MQQGHQIAALFGRPVGRITEQVEPPCHRAL
jgi:hypothetical protein